MNFCHQHHVYVTADRCWKLEPGDAEVHAMWITVISILFMLQQTDAGNLSLESLSYARCGLLSSATCLCYSKQIQDVRAWSRCGTRDVGYGHQHHVYLPSSRCWKLEPGVADVHAMCVTVISIMFMLKQTDAGS